MTADSVPAPMVQVPAAEWDRLKLAMHYYDAKDPLLAAQDRAEVIGAARALVAVVDAATPAASVPAADKVEAALREAAHTLIEHRLMASQRPEKWADEDKAYNAGIEHCTDWLIRCANERAVVDAATPAASVPAADILALANEWYPGTPGPRRMTSWARLAYQDCARELRALVDERQPQRCEHGILRRLDCFECNEVAAAEQADKGEGGQRGGKSQDTATPHDPPLTAPAAPPDPSADSVNASVHRATRGGYTSNKQVSDLAPPPKGPAPGARVPVNDEAQAAWQAIQPAWFGDSETAFEAGFRAARQGGNSDE